MQDKLKLERKIIFHGKLRLLTGMHIGGSSLGLSIGGADKVVVRNPVSNLPYAPGSSIKGKLRSLLEKSHGLVDIEANGDGWEGKLCSNPSEPLVQLFGFAADMARKTGGMETAAAILAPTRLSVRDGDLLNIEEIEQGGNTDMHGTEVKTEVSIDRLTSAANPRNFERVPAGAEFSFEMVVDIYNLDLATQQDGATMEQRFMEYLREGLRLLEDDYLGGQGSRGYGQVRVVLDTITERSAEDYRAHKLEKRPSQYTDFFAEFKESREVESGEAAA